MRQNTCLMALGMFFCGSSDSPAATPINSVPWKEKPAIKNTPSAVKNWPVKPLPKNGASPKVRFLKPTYSPPKMPKMVSTPTAKNTTTVITLMMANQNSDSPYTRTDSMFKPMIKAKNSKLQPQCGINCIGSQ